MRWEVAKDMAMRSDRRPTPNRKRPAAASDDTVRRLEVTVVFTSESAIATVLGQADALANKLGARITLLAPQIVPYPIPLEDPPVQLEFSERRFAEMARLCRVD